MKLRFIPVVIVLVFVCLLWLPSCDATRLPPEWCAKLTKLCDSFDDDQPNQPVIIRMHCLQPTQENFDMPMMYLFPPVILWSPLEQFRTSLQIDLECPKCLSSGRNNVSLHPTGWRDGVHGERSEPRKVYGTDGVTIGSNFS